MTGAPIPAVEAPQAAAVRSRATTRSGPSLGRGFLHLSLILLMVLWAIPTVALLVASFRPAAATNTSGWWTAITPPWEFTLDNYEYVLGRAGIDQAFVNSFIITIPATIMVIADPHPPSPCGSRNGYGYHHAVAPYGSGVSSPRTIV